MPRNALKSNIGFYLYFGISLGIILAYFIAMYVISRQYLDGIRLETKELNVLAKAEFQMALA